MGGLLRHCSSVKQRKVRRPVTNRIFKKSESLPLSDAEATTPATPPPPKAIVCPKRPPVHHIRSESPPSSDKRATADLGRSSGPVKYEGSTKTEAVEVRTACGTDASAASLSLERTRHTTTTTTTTFSTFPRFPLRERRRRRSNCDVLLLSDPPCLQETPRASEDSSAGEEGGEQTPTIATVTQPPLVDILENRSPEPMSLRSLLLYAKRNLMDENILFFLEVSSLKSGGGGQTEYLAHVKRIYNLYIRPASPREVNISGDIHIATSAAVHAVLNAPRVDVDDDSCDSDTSTLVKVGTDEESPNAATDCERSAEEGGGDGGEGREEEGEGVQTVVDCLEALRSARQDVKVGAGGGSHGGKKVGESGLGGTGGRTGGVANAAAAAAAAIAAARATRAAKRRPGSQRIAARGRPILESSPSPDSGGSLRPHSRSMSLPGMSPLSIDARLLTAPPTAESVAGEGADDSGGSATRITLEDSICFQGPSKLLSGTALVAGRGTREPSPVAVAGGGADGEESGSSRAVEQPEKREARLEREPGRGGLSVRCRRDHVNCTWVRDPDDANLGSQGGLGLDASGEIKRLNPGGGPGGGFGDRSIFDSAQNEIYDILRTEVYPKFAADVFARSREGSPTPPIQDVNSAKTRGSATSKVKVLMKAMMSMRSG